MAKSQQLVVIQPLKPPANLKTIGNALARAKTPEEVLEFERRVAAYEAYMRRAGFDQGDLHELNEHRMRARWRLGQMLKAIKRKAGPGRGKKMYRDDTSFREMLKRLGYDPMRAVESQRIGELPKLELEKIFQKAREIGELVTIAWLVDAARPYWYKDSREQKHKDIAAAAMDNSDEVRPFPLLYVDPPTEFEVYSEKGLGKAPDQHYPTMTDAEIVDYMKPFVPEVGAVMWWCTSSNLKRALTVMEACGYAFKTSFVWVKLGEDGEPISGMGLVARNMHEVILYGTIGNMPGPQYQPPSVFFYKRGRHSAKPPEIRVEIEKMYPDFDARTRAELFFRKEEYKLEGWSTYGFESGQRNQAAE